MRRFMFLASVGVVCSLGASQAFAQDGAPSLKDMGCKDAAACVTTGMTYYKKSEFPDARKYFQAACAEKQPQACENLGVMAYQGQGEQKDVEKALGFFRKACAFGQVTSCRNAGAEFFKGKITKRDYGVALELFERGCELDDSFSCYNAGVLRADEAIGHHDPKRAVEHLEKGCKKNHAGACDALGRLFYKGQGVPKDPARGVDSFERACGLGKALSCQTGGLLLVNGEGGVKQDDARGKMLLAKGCKLGDAKSCAAGKDAPKTSDSGSNGSDKKFNLSVNSMTVDGMEATDLRCNLAKGGFMASAMIIGGLSKQKSAMDRCAGSNAYSPRISMTFSGGSASGVKVEGVPEKVASCVQKSVEKKVKANVSGNCEVTVKIGK